MIDHLVIAAGEAFVAKLYQLFALVDILHHCTPILRREDIGEHFETHLVEVLNCLRFRVAQVLPGKEIDYCRLDEGPVFGQNVGCLRVCEHEKTEEIAYGDFVLVLRDLGKFGQLVDGLSWNRRNIERGLDPLHEVRSRLHLACRVGREVANELLHLVHLAGLAEADRQSVHWLELLVTLLHVLASFAAEGSLQLTEGISELDFVSTHELVTLLPVEHEVELGNRLNLEGLRSLSVMIRLHSTEDDVLVLIGATGSFETWFEPHAWSTAW